MRAWSAALGSVLVAACGLALALVALAPLAAFSQAPSSQPWLNTKLSPDERARLLEKELTLDERIRLLHGPMALSFGGFVAPQDVVPSAGYIPGIPRLGIPALRETDASLGVTNPLRLRKGDGATALPSGLALASTFNTKLAYESGATIGAEARAKGFNVLLAGGVNLARDPRNGRNFEYLGEDPLLAGTLAGESIRGIQSRKVISTAKHFVLNGQETNRHWANSKIDPAALRESDLLAFQIAIERGQPGSIMCAYNLVNGAYSCGNDYLLNTVLKKDWAYKGWVMSDWGAVRAMDFALKGLDQQSGEQIDDAVHFGDPLKAAAQNGTVPAERISDMVRRILRSMFAVGVFDDPPVKSEIDYKANALVAQRAAEEGIVLLRNRDNLLPLNASLKRVAVIGGMADRGVLSGSGSSQVYTPGDTSVVVPLGGEGPMAMFRNMTFHPSSPLAAIRAKLPGAQVSFDDGRYASSAAALAKRADIAIVFANQWMAEGEDAPDLSLPEGQDALIDAVTAANPNTIVVLQTGGPVEMPWLDKTGAVVETWYSGVQGGVAITAVLFGDVNPSGRLPMTFPKSINQYPRAELPGWGLPEKNQFDVVYSEGADVGYRHFAKTREAVLFPFGYGLSYTRFGYSKLKATGGQTLTVSFDVTNQGSRTGKVASQVYLAAINGQPIKRLIGFDKIELKPGETRRVTLKADPRLLAQFDASANRWQIQQGEYRVVVGASSIDEAASATARLQERTLPP